MKNQLQSSIVLVGLMGSGKTSVGRRFASAVGAEFVDVDAEIEKVSDRTIADIFSEFGEGEFRALETRVLTRLMAEKPRVIATGGGAFISEVNRNIIDQSGVSVWLDAELQTLWDRVRHKTHRPLLHTDNPKQTLADIMTKRNPIYAMADHRVVSQPNQTHEAMVEKIVVALGLEIGE